MKETRRPSLGVTEKAMERFIQQMILDEENSKEMMRYRDQADGQIKAVQVQTPVRYTEIIIKRTDTQYGNTYTFRMDLIDIEKIVKENREIQIQTNDYCIVGILESSNIQTIHCPVIGDRLGVTEIGIYPLFWERLK